MTKETEQTDQPEALADLISALMEVPLLSIIAFTTESAVTDNTVIDLQARTGAESARLHHDAMRAGGFRF